MNLNYIDRVSKFGPLIKDSVILLPSIKYLLLYLGYRSMDE